MRSRCATAGTDGFTVQRLLQRVKTDSTIIGNLAAVLIE